MSHPPAKASPPAARPLPQSRDGADGRAGAPVSLWIAVKTTALALRRAEWLAIGLVLGTVFLAAALPAGGAAQAAMPVTVVHTVFEILATTLLALAAAAALCAAGQRQSLVLSGLGSALMVAAILNVGHLLTFPGMPGADFPARQQVSLILARSELLAIATGLYILLRFDAADPMYRPAWRVSAPPALALLLVFVGMFAAYHGSLGMIEEWDEPGTVRLAITAGLIFLFAGLVARFARRYAVARSPRDRLLFVAAILLVLNETTFVRTGDLPEIPSLLPQLVKLLAYSFIALAIFRETIREPYRRLQITGRAFAENARRLHELVEMSSDWLWRQDQTLRFVSVSPGFDRLIGRTGDGCVGLCWRELLDGSDTTGLEQLEQAQAAHHPFQGIVARLADARGVVREVCLGGRPVFDAEGRLCGYHGVGRDISRLQSAAEALRDRERRTRATFDHAGVGIAHLTMNGRLLLANDTLCRWLGRSANELTALTRGELTHPADHATEEDLCRSLLAGQAATYELEKRLVRGDGAFLWVRLRAVLLRKTDGSPDYFVHYLHDLSAAKRLEAEVVDQHKNLRRALSLAKMAVWELDLRTRSVHFSQKLMPESAGVNPTDVTSMDEALGCVHPDDRALIDAGLRAALETGEPPQIDHRLQLPGGEIRHVVTRAEVVERLDGRPVRLRGITQDISDRKRMENALRESEARFRSLSVLSADWHWEQDAQHRLVKIDGPRGDAVWARTLIGKTRWEIDYANMTADDWAQHRATLERHETFRDLELQRDDPSRAPRTITLSGEPVFDAGGLFLGYRGVGRDVTELRKAQHALAADEALLAGINQAAMDGIVTFDAERRIVSFNPTVERMFGYSASELLNAKLDDLIAGEVRDFHASQLVDFAGGLAGAASTTVLAIRGLRKTGAEFPLEVSLARVAVDGAPQCTAIIRDLSVLEDARNALASNQRRLQTISDNLPVVLGYIDSDERYQYVNKTYESWYGRPQSEYIGRRVRDIVGEERYTLFKPHLARALAGERIEREFRTRSTLEQYARYVFAPDYGADGKVKGLYFLGHDITEIRRAREQSERLNQALERGVEERTRQLSATNHELEMFSYSVSHDLRTPLRGIEGFSRLLDEQYGNQLEPAARQYIERIRRNVVRMGELIDDLIELSRISRSEVRRTRVDVTALAQNVLAQLAASTPTRRVAVTVAKGLSAEADSRLVLILLENLLGNAWKFTARTAEASIEVGSHPSERDNPIFIQDNGAGFEMKYAHRLFGPFQRLHGAEEFPGSGIGLAIVKRIVNLHGGRILAQGTPGAGATFHFTL